MTARPALSVKSIPSDTFPRHTPRSTAPDLPGSAGGGREGVSQSGVSDQWGRAARVGERGRLRRGRRGRGGGRAPVLIDGGPAPSSFWR